MVFILSLLMVKGWEEMKRDWRGRDIDYVKQSITSPLQSQKCERVLALRTKTRIHDIIPAEVGNRDRGRERGEQTRFC